jgi:hypothetical protein
MISRNLTPEARAAVTVLTSAMSRRACAVRHMYLLQQQFNDFDDDTDDDDDDDDDVAAACDDID